MVSEYTDEVLKLIDKWKKEATELEKIHSDLSDHFSRKAITYGSIPIIVPVVLTFTTLVLPMGVGIIVASAGLAIVSIATGLVSFMDFKSKSMEHGFSSFRYNQLINNIDSNLARDPEHQMSQSVLITYINNELKNLKCYSPRTSGNCLFSSLFVCFRKQR